MRDFLKGKRKSANVILVRRKEVLAAEDIHFARWPLQSKFVRHVASGQE